MIKYKAVQQGTIVDKGCKKASHHTTSAASLRRVCPNRGRTFSGGARRVVTSGENHRSTNFRARPSGLMQINVDTPEKGHGLAHEARFMSSPVSGRT